MIWIYGRRLVWWIHNDWQCISVFFFSLFNPFFPMGTLFLFFHYLFEKIRKILWRFHFRESCWRTKILLQMFLVLTLAFHSIHLICEIIFPDVSFFFLSKIITNTGRPFTWSKVWYLLPLLQLHILSSLGTHLWACQPSFTSILRSRCWFLPRGMSACWRILLLTLMSFSFRNPF